MMMKMLEAGGVEPMTDHQRQPDEDNPGGYYELEQVKKVREDPAWLAQADGKAVKVISRLLCDLPAGYRYRVIFMQRNLDEVLVSQRQMLVRRGRAGEGVRDEDMRRIFVDHLGEVETWLARQDHFRVLYVKYDEVLSDPRGQSERVNACLGGALDVESMAGVVDKQLYRQRR
jgi:hypothetical protein